MAVLAGILIMTGVFQPSSAVVLLVCFVLMFLMAWARTIPVRLEITETEVRARQGRWRGKPDVEAPRGEIRAIRYYPARISFRGADDEPLMEPEPHWTVRQMVKVAVELGVPLYDHKGTLGPEELIEGRLAYDPASGLVAWRKLRSSAVACPVVSLLGGAAGRRHRIRAVLAQRLHRQPESGRGRRAGHAG
ncbi:MAG TPA: hypothetical protein VG142_03860 [Trebonia sp.]|nr:hypothetical protein [Trebonia sp.]